MSTHAPNNLQYNTHVRPCSIAGTIFANRLQTALALYAPNLDPDVAEAVRHSVAVIKTLSGADKDGVVKAYAEALGYTFILSIPCGLMGTLSAL